MIVCAFFVFILLFGESRDRVHSFLVFVFSMAGWLSPSITADYGTAQYVQQFEISRSISVLVLCFAAASFIPALALDKKAWMHASVFVVLILIEASVVHKLTAPHHVISNFLYIWYDEALIIISLIQISISYDAFSSSLRRVQDHILGRNDVINCYSEDCDSFSEF